MKSNKIILAASSLLLLCSCSDFLDKEPLVDMVAETYYSNSSEVNTAVLGAYSYIQTESYQLSSFLVVGDDCSDDYDLGNEYSEAFGWFGSPCQQLQRFEADYTNWVSSGLWSQAWSLINAANTIIDRVEANPELPEKCTHQYLGEAYFLRGFAYFFLCRQYGGMPLADHVLSYEEYYIPRSSQADTWTFIEQCFSKAAELLPKKSEMSSDELGRATQGAAYAMLGKTCLYAKDYQGCADALKQVIDSKEYQLETEFSDFFALSHENGCESVFEIQQNTSGTGWSDSNEGSILPFYEHDGCREYYAEWGYPDPQKYMHGWSMHCPTPDLVAEFEEGDPRLHKTIIFPGDMFDGRINKNLTSSTGYQSKKWFTPWADRAPDESDTPNNILFVRYADVLLMYAEALNELGKSSNALDYLEQVRARARGGDNTVLPKVTTTSQTGLRDAIWHERRVELAGEGQRFWDICRQGRAAQLMKAFYNKYKDGIDVDYCVCDGDITKATMTTIKWSTTKGRSFQEGVSELCPIPQSAISSSNNTFEQNPGY